MNNQETIKLEKKVQKNLKEIIGKNTLILGVSGGADSVFLLKMLQAIDAKIHVAHINHKLRSKDSDLDEEFVKNLDPNFSIKKLDIKKLSKERKTGIEETGRKVRYDFFKELAKKKKAKFIITAHHADDNLETILLNLSRGATLKGLSGMQEIEKISNNLFLFRPLLFISKNEIIDYLKFKKIKYRTDKSNKNLIYKRNHIRLKIIPELKKINPNIIKTVAKNAKNIKTLDEELENKAVNWLKKNCKSNKLDAKKFREENTSIQKYILMQCHQNIIGNTQNIESIHLEECLNLINKNIGNKTKRLGKIKISIKNNIISLKK